MDYAGELADNTSTSGRITVGGTATSQLETAFDQDWFRISLVAGEAYVFDLQGVGGSGELSDPYLRLYRNGVEVAENDDSGGTLDSRITFTAQATGNYYLEAAGYSNSTGEYRLSAEETAPPPPPLQGGPVLSSIDWGSVLADNTVNVYFARSGESFAGFASAGWNSYEIGQTMAVLAEMESMVDLTFNRVTSSLNADFSLVIQSSASFSGLMFPPGEPNSGVGVFARNAPGWDEGGNGGLEQGGGGFQLLLHELGHGLGLAHPHDNGGTSDVMDGVSSSRGDYGDFNLNQAVFTNMSYNDGLPAEGAGPHSSDTYGYTGTLSPLDIAALQERYGAVEANEGDTTYQLDGTNGIGTFFAAIWDTGGTDWIEHSGTRDSTIDLRAATLQYEEGGGGYVSRADGVRGGFTIAHDVVIENARGSSGNDSVNGNAVANELHGEGGEDQIYGFQGEDTLFGGGAQDDLYGGADNDVLDGGAAADTLHGGAGMDFASYQSSSVGVTVDLANTAQSSGHARNDDYISIEGIRGSGLRDTLRGDDEANILQGAEGNDTLSGRDGDDILEGGSGGDRHNGGAGLDSAAYTTSQGRVTVDLMQSANNSGDAAGDTYNSIEGVIGSGFADLLRGSDDDDLLVGGGGDDTLSGRDGDDTIIGGAGGDRFNGGSGADTASYADASSGVRADLIRTDINTGDAAGDSYNSVESLAGSALDDQLRGTNAANTLIGGEGGDTLLARSGRDILIGGDGDDTMNGGAGVDTFIFADLDEGADTIDGFEANRDIIAFNDDLGLTFANLSITSSGSDVEIDYGGDTLTLSNTAVADVTQSNFDFDYMLA